MRVHLLSRSRVTLAVSFAVLVAIVAVAALAGVLVGGDPASGAAQSEWDVARQAVSVPGGILVWVVPDASSTTSDDLMTEDGELYARIVDAAGRIQTSSLGKGVTASLVRGGTSPVLLIETYGSQRRFVAFEPDVGGWRVVGTVDDEVLACSADVDSIDYVLDGADSVTTLPLASGAALDSKTERALPSPSPNAGVVAEIEADEDTRAVYAQAGASADLAPASVAQLVRKGGQLYAFECTGFGGGVANVATSTYVELSGVRFIDGAGIGGDGDCYVVADGVGRGSSQRVLRLDGETMVVEGTAMTGWAKNSTDAPGRLNSLTLLPTSTGAFLSIIEQPQYPSGESGRLLVWNLDQTGVRKLCVLPNATGMKVGLGKADTILLYCGPAQNAVYRLDPLSGKTSAVADMTAPEGSYVVVAAE